LKEISLFNGKIGIAIAFFCYGKYTHNKTYLELADDLIDGYLSQVDKKIGISFASGLSGIGWAIEYLIQNNFVACNSNQACGEIDHLVVATDIRRISDVSLSSGIEGLLHYVLARIKGAISQKNPIPFDQQYLADLHHKLQSINQESISPEFKLLMQSFDSFMNERPFNYELNIELWIGCTDFEEKDISKAMLGLNNGLAGKLMRIAQVENLN